MIKITQIPRKTDSKTEYEGLCVIKNFLDISTAYDELDDEADDDDYETSPVFCTGPNKEFDWSLDVYTRGYCYPKYVSLVLNLHDNYRTIKYLKDWDTSYFVASVIDVDSIKYSTKWTSFKNSNAHDGVIIKDFVLREDLQNNPKLLPNDELRILFKISYDEGMVEDESPIEWVDISLKNHSKLFNKIYDDAQYTDFKLVVNEKVFNVHRAILAARSPVFKAMFDSQMRESSEGTATIVDIEAAVIDKLLRFVYSGNVESIDDIADKLLVAAEKYQIDELKFSCEKILAKLLCIGNVYDTLRLADANNAEQLKENAVKFFHLNAKELSSNVNFKDNLNSLSTLLKTDIICYLIDGQ